MAGVRVFPGEVDSALHWFRDTSSSAFSWDAHLTALDGDAVFRGR